MRDIVCRNNTSMHTIKFWKYKAPGFKFSKALFEGLIFGGAYIRRGLCTEGNLRFKMNWASLILGRKFTVFFVLFCIWGQFPSTSPPGGSYIWRGDLTDGFLRYECGGLIFGGAYTWRGLFSVFYGIYLKLFLVLHHHFGGPKSGAYWLVFFIIIFFFFFCVL